MRPERWLDVAGFGTWLISAPPTLMAIASGRMDVRSAIVWGIASAVFGLALGLRCAPRLTGRWPRWSKVGLLMAQTATSLIMVASDRGNVLMAATLVVVAGQLEFVLGTRGALAWVAGQSAALGVILLRSLSPVLAVTVAGSFAGFQLFAVAASTLVLSERRAREALASANAELHATRALMAENSRVAERLRISRDLHDMLGHHLTALSLQLDVASRLVEGKPVEHVRQAHAITKLLLGDVRDVVSQLRESSRFDLAQAVRPLAEPAGVMTVHVDVPDALVLEDGERAQALLRCVQEIVTNAARHANARNLWLRLEARDGGVALHAHDDGRGAAAVTLGNGLMGMQERFGEHAGQIEFTTGVGGGFEVRAFMPGGQAA